MCLDAIMHIPDAIEYMSLIRNQSVFNFCAIPQVSPNSLHLLCVDSYLLKCIDFLP
jgi:farnesyl-diphosphate farnesyltransferase